MISLTPSRESEQIAVVVSDDARINGSKIYLNRHALDYSNVAPKAQCGLEDIKSGRIGRRVRRADEEIIEEAIESMQAGDSDDPPEGLREELADLYRGRAAAKQRSLLGKDLKVVDGTVMPMPIKRPGFREAIFVIGPAGAGKSTWAVRYIVMWKQMFPRGAVYRFSRVEDDRTFDRIKGMYKNVVIDERMLSEPVTAEMLKSMSPDQPVLVVFDDIDTIKDDNVRESVMKLRDDLLETGRHNSFYVISTSHKAMNWNSTKTSTNEATAVTFFPRSGTSGSIRDFLRKKCGYDADKIKRLMNLPSLWVTVYLTYPNYTVHEHGVFLD